MRTFKPFQPTGGQAALLALIALLWAAPAPFCAGAEAHPASQAADQRRHAPDAGFGAAQDHARLPGQAAPAANPLEPAVGGLWRQPATRREAGAGPHRALGHEQTGGGTRRGSRQGVYVYEAEANLCARSAGDLRAKMGAPPAGAGRPSPWSMSPASLDYAQVDVGFIGQNVYLFAASEGLNAWFYALHGQQDATAVAAALKLPAEKRPLYAQSVGYPPQVERRSKVFDWPGPGSPVFGRSGRVGHRPGPLARAVRPVIESKV
jgi:nitroreductase